MKVHPAALRIKHWLWFLLSWGRPYCTVSTYANFYAMSWVTVFNGITQFTTFAGTCSQLFQTSQLEKDSYFLFSHLPNVQGCQTKQLCMKWRNSFLHFPTMSISWSALPFAEEPMNDLALMNSHKNSRGAPSKGETNKQKYCGNAAPSLNLTWITTNNKLPKQACIWDQAYDHNSICRKPSWWNYSSFVNPVRWQILHMSMSHKMREDCTPGVNGVTSTAPL